MTSFNTNNDSGILKSGSDNKQVGIAVQKFTGPLNAKSKSIIIQFFNED